MTDNISLGKNGKAGNIDFSKIKSGIKKEDFVKGDAKLASIFDSVDKDGNKVLDRGELEDLQKELNRLAGDDAELSKKEAKQFTDKDGNKIGRKNRDALFDFLNKLTASNQDVKSVETKDVNGQDVEVITYNDGRTEELYPNGTKIIMIKSGNKTVTTKEDKDGNTLAKTETTVEDGVETVLEYEGETPKSKTVTDTKNNTVSIYTFEGEEPVLVQEENTKTGDITTYKDGVKTTTKANGQVITEKDGVVTVTDGNTVTVTDGEKTQTRTLDPENGIETLSTIEDGVETTLSRKDGRNISQTITKDGESYSVEYDGNGNTKGVIVQNGESLSAIAKRFGCSVKDLAEANKEILNGKKYFQVGAEIVIPGEIAADKFAVLNAGRKTSEEAKAEYAYDAQIRAEKRAAAAAREKAEMEALGIVNRNGAGTVINSETKATEDGKFKNFNKNAEAIKKLTFTVVGETGNRERMVVKASNGKYYTMAKDGIILNEGYAVATKALDAGQAASRNDGRGRKVVVVDGKQYVFSQDGKLLKSDYIEATDIRDAGGAKATVSGNGITFVKGEDGTIRYFDKNGKLITGAERKQLIQAETQKAADIIYKAAHGLGTNEENLTQGVNMIYSPEIMAGVNTILSSKDSDYAGDAQTTPLEALLLDELSRSEVRQHIKTLAANGAYGTGESRDAALGRNAAREIQYEVHGGVFGYTGTADLKEAMGVASTRGARLATEEYFQDGKVKGLADEGSMVRQYIAEDGWNAQEVDQFDATWIKNNAYDSEHDQEHRNAVVGRLVFSYDSDEALHTGLDAVNDDPESADQQYLTQRAVEENTKNNYSAHFTNQDAVQIYLAGRTANEDGTVDAEHVTACNTLLFKGEKPVRIQAEENLYNAQKGDMSTMFDSMDPEVYSAMSELIANGDVKGCKSLEETYNKLMAETGNINDRTKIKANAILSGQIEFSDEEIADFCVELMHRIDSNRGAGSSTGYSAELTNLADYETEQLKAILQANPQVAAAVKENIQKGDFSYTTRISTPNDNGPATVTEFKHDTKSDYLAILDDSKHIVSDAVFYDEEGKQVTDPAQIQALTEANMNALNNMREYVAQLEREFKKGVDTEGTFSDAANWLSTYSGLGTDRSDVATEYRNAKLLLNQLEAAAQGKLRDSEGNVVSVQDLAQNIIDKENSLAQTNSDYQSTIQTAKMGMILAPVIVVTTVATAGTGAGFWATAGIAGVATAGTEYGLNTIERMTSITGDTAEAREEHATSALIDGASTFIGVGQMKFIPKILNNAGAFVRGGGRLVTVAASDIGVGAAGEYVQTGTVTINGVTMNAIFSVTGNLIGIKSLAQKHVDVSAPNVDVNLNGRDVIADGEIARNIDLQHVDANQRRIVEEGLQDVPTPEELAAYQRENGYQAPTPEERAALDAHQEQVAADYAEAHRIENNAVIKESKQPAAPKEAIDRLNDEIRGLDGQIRDINRRIAGAKRFGKDTSKLEAQLEGLQQKRAGKQAELETLQKPAAEAEVPVRSEETPDAAAKAEPEVRKPTLSEEQKETVYGLREIYHGELDDIEYLRSAYPQYSNMSDAELLDYFKLDENHAAFVKNRTDLFADGEAKYDELKDWNHSPYEKTNNHCAWKMHLFSIDELDYQQMAEVVLPYLNKHKIAHKTLDSITSPELLARTDPQQAGKAFTIYPQSQEEMAMIAKDLDRLIREHNLTTANSHITGDNQLGNSGRLFYRYEFPTGKLKDNIYKPDEYTPYDGNRGEGQYLADDMTPADDPWLHFDPSDPNAKPGANAASPEANPVIVARELTPEERNAMGQIGNNINKAKTLEDLEKAQQWLDKMPECSQKTALQNQLDEKLNKLKASAQTVEVIETVDFADVEDEIVASLLSPQEAFVYDLQDKLGCSANYAEQLANKINAKPEIAEQLSSLALTPGRAGYEIDNLINMATPENIDTLTKLNKNSRLSFHYDKHGNLTKNDFEIVMKIADSVPAYKADLIDIAANTQRPDTDIYNIARLMSRYPDKAHDIAILTKSNANIKVGYDLNNQLSTNIDDIIIYMDQYPEFNDEILDYMSVQRRALNDTSDPVADLPDHIETLKKFPQHKNAINQLVQNPNLDAMDIRSILGDYGNNSQLLNDAIALSQKKYTIDSINRNINNFKKYPGLRSIMLSDAPQFTLIDKNVNTTPIEVIQKRFAIRQNIESVAGEELAALQRTLGNEFFPKVKWEEIIPDNASNTDIKNIVAQLNDESKFFARTAGNERRYGKNIQWGHDMNNISEAAALRISHGDSFDDVISNIAADYRAYDEAGTLATNTDVDARRQCSGVYRGNWPREKRAFGASTGFGAYPEYIDRFNAMANIKRTYNGIELTTIGPNPNRGSGLYMLHPTSQNVQPAMKQIGSCYDRLQPLVQKVQNGGTLSSAELKFVDEQMAEMYFIMGNVMPWARGSNGISDLFMRSTYKALGINQPALKKGVSLDLEAFCMDINEYKTKWNSFFEY